MQQVGETPDWDSTSHRNGGWPAEPPKNAGGDTDTGTDHYLGLPIGVGGSTAGDNPTTKETRNAANETPCEGTNTGPNAECRCTDNSPDASTNSSSCGCSS